MGVLLLKEDRYEEALPVLERSLAIREAHYGQMHPNVATGLNNAATVLEKLGEDSRAKAMFARALEIREQTLGSGHSKTESSRANLTHSLSL